MITTVSGSSLPTSQKNDLEDDIDIAPHTADCYLANEMAKLSVRDREKVYHDIHGITNQMEESPQLIQISLLALDEQLEYVKVKEAYETAKSIDPTYVSNNDFRLQFLRAERFDVKKAASRLVLHFRIKHELFGREKLCKNITQDDLDDDDIDALYDGYQQILPLRDQAGRVVFVSMVSYAPRDDERTMQARCRRKFYTKCVAAQDEETQKRGCVLVIYAVDATCVQLERKYMRLYSEVSEAVPLRIEAVHFCYHHLVWLSNIALFKLLGALFTAFRFCTHYGTRTDILFKLQTYGIPVFVIPLTEDGETTVAQNKEIWEQRRVYERRIEKSEETTKVFQIPGRFDILLGRGRGYHNHVGNVKLRNLILDLKPQYNSSSKSEKKPLTENVVHTIKKMPARFLKLEAAGWVEVDDEEARLKVSHTFRNLKLVNKAQKSETRPKKQMDDIVEEPSTKKRQKDETSTKKREKDETFGRQFYPTECDHQL